MPSGSDCHPSDFTKSRRADGDKSLIAMRNSMSGRFISRDLATRDACHEFHEAGAVEYLMLWNFYGDACLVVCGWSATQTDPVSAFSEHELLVGVYQPVFRF